MNQKMSEHTLLHYTDLVTTYVDICNQALQQNCDRFPFKQILGAARISEKDHPIEVNVTSDICKESYVFRLNGHGIEVAPHTRCEHCDCVRTWDVSKDYLEMVTQSPAAFIQNPAKINWEWMYDQ